MNKILYDTRCRCNEEFSISKKRKPSLKSEGKPIQYPNSNEIKLKTFKIKYEKDLSSNAKFILNSFQNKYIYYAIDDILYGSKSNLNEQDSLLTILYSAIIFLQNNFYVNFFDIWISEIYIEEILKSNKFLSNNSRSSKSFNFITIKLFYKSRISIKKQEFLW